MDIQIRQAELKDVESLRKIDLLSFQENRIYDTHIDQNWIYSPRAVNYFTHAIQDQNHTVFIAISDGVPVGFINIIPKVVEYRTARIAEIDNIAVIPAFRSHGIGMNLLTVAREWALKNHFTILYVSSYAKNTIAIQLYKNFGFTDIEVGLELELRT